MRSKTETLETSQDFYIVVRPVTGKNKVSPGDSDGQGKSCTGGRGEAEDQRGSLCGPLPGALGFSRVQSIVEFRVCYSLNFGVVRTQMLHQTGAGFFQYGNSNFGVQQGLLDAGLQHLLSGSGIQLSSGRTGQHRAGLVYQ